MLNLIKPSDIKKALKMDRTGKIGTAAGWVFMQLLGMGQINKIYKKISSKQGLDFVNAIIEELNIDLEFPESDLQRIPEKGPFITVSNHPLGGVDGVLLLKILGQRRPDYKVLSSFILKNIPQLEDAIIHINSSDSQNISGLKNALTYLSQPGLSPVSVLCFLQ